MLYIKNLFLPVLNTFVKSEWLLLKGVLCRERSSEHVLTIMAKDHVMPGKHNFARVRVHVQDVNDNAPEWNGGVLQTHVLETVVLNTPIITLVTSDKDEYNNSLLTYSIVSGKFFTFIIEIKMQYFISII